MWRGLEGKISGTAHDLHDPLQQGGWVWAEYRMARATLAITKGAHWAVWDVALFDNGAWSEAELSSERPAKAGMQYDF